MASTLKVGFLGAGKMASALAKGFLAAKIVAPKQILASDHMEPARAAFGRDVGGGVTDSNLEVLRFANVLILAVKPDQVPHVLSELKPGFSEKHLLISIAAGVTLAKLEDALPLR